METNENIISNTEFAIKADNLSVVKCANCGWDWEFSTGGDKPLFCHKCFGKNSNDKKHNFSPPPNKEFTPLPDGVKKQQKKDSLTEQQKTAFVFLAASVICLTVFVILKKQ